MQERLDLRRLDKITRLDINDSSLDLRLELKRLVPNTAKFNFITLSLYDLWSRPYEVAGFWGSIAFFLFKIFDTMAFNSDVIKNF